MPYLHDPRKRVTLNLLPDEYAALAADAIRAGHASAGTYALALVRARGAAPRPVVDENGAQRVARLQGKLAAVREALASSQDEVTALTRQLRRAKQELAARPTAAEQQSMIAEAVAAAMAARA